MNACGTVVFCDDASVEIGTGHVMRCLTLADRLRERGVRCRFVSRDRLDALAAPVRNRGHDLDLLPSGAAARTDGTAHEGWLAADWRTDAQQMLDAVGGERAQWSIVDDYGADSRWEALLHPACGRMLIIDDLADRPHACLSSRITRGARRPHYLMPERRGSSIYAIPARQPSKMRSDTCWKTRGA